MKLTSPSPLSPIDTRGHATGTEWIVDAQGCGVESLRNLPLISQVCESVIADLGLNVVGDPLCHQFPSPGGVTALYLLSESHLACHTYPEFAQATFNLYCCRNREAWPWSQRLRDLIGATDVQVRSVNRGGFISQRCGVLGSDDEAKP